MEHIVQFAIGIDDEAIRQRVIDSAYNDVVKQLMEEAKRETRLSAPYYRKQTWSDILDHALRGYIEENKDLVIELAATKLANSYQRSKAFKEAMAQKMEEM